MDLQSLAELSDSDLLVRVKRLAQAESRATAALIAHLVEVENRKLYLGEACSSLFAYCVRVLHYSEPAAYNRIFAARAARTFPAVLDHLERGDVHLAAVRLLAPVLTAENQHELLAAAAHKSKREVEELVVRLRPREDARESIRKLGAVAGPGVESAPLAPAQQPVQVQRASVVPLAPERYKIQFTAGATTRDNLRRAQELLRHRIPGGDISQVIDLALDLLVRDLEKKKFASLAPRASKPKPETPSTAAATAASASMSTSTRPSASTSARSSTSTPTTPPTAPVPATAAAVSAAAAAGAATGSRYIPAEVRRAVWQRDQGCCAFMTANGERCGERAGLEFDHIRPHADGGRVDVNNIRLLCRQHNQYEARQFFGRWHADDEPVPRCG